MKLADFVTEAEYSSVLDGVKDLLKETYMLSDREAESVILQCGDKANEYLHDYMPYVKRIRDIKHHLRETLDTQFERTVDAESELRRKMESDAAVWLTFECIRRFCQKSLIS